MSKNKPKSNHNRRDTRDAIAPNQAFWIVVQENPHLARSYVQSRDPNPGTPDMECHPDATYPELVDMGLDPLRSLSPSRAMLRASPNIGDKYVFY